MTFATWVVKCKAKASCGWAGVKPGLYRLVVGTTARESIKCGIQNNNQE